ncbi:RES domain-containing protein [Sphingobium xenophagum]
MAQPDPHFEPPADLASRALPIETIAPGTALYRLHRSDLGALHFGKTGHNRFDDPQSIFGVCYLALSLEGAFAETCLRAVGATLLSYTFLAERSVTTVVAARTLRTRLPAWAGPCCGRRDKHYQQRTTCNGAGLVARAS